MSHTTSPSPARCRVSLPVSLGVLSLAAGKTQVGARFAEHLIEFAVADGKYTVGVVSHFVAALIEGQLPSAGAEQPAETARRVQVLVDARDWQRVFSAAKRARAKVVTAHIGQDGVTLTWGGDSTTLPACPGRHLPAEIAIDWHRSGATRKQPSKLALQGNQWRLAERIVRGVLPKPSETLIELSATAAILAAKASGLQVTVAVLVDPDAFSGDETPDEMQSPTSQRAKKNRPLGTRRAGEDSARTGEWTRE